jgi:hypothetical protein
LDLATVYDLFELQVIGIVNYRNRLLVVFTLLIFASNPTSVENEILSCLDKSEGARGRKLVDVQAIWERAGVELNLSNSLTAA